MKRSRFVAYIDPFGLSSEVCCSEGHATAQEAAEHAARVRKERKDERTKR